MSGTLPLRVSCQPGGWATQLSDTLFGDLAVQMPAGPIPSYFNDFFTYAAGDWTVTTSTGSSALVAAQGGTIVLTTAASNSDIQANWLNPAPFVITAGYPAWFGIRFAISSLTPACGFGLCPTNSAAAPINGIYLTKAAAASALVLNVEKASTNTTLTIPGTLVAATTYTVGWYYNGDPQNGAIKVFSTVNNTQPNIGAQVPPAVGGFAVSSQTTLTNLPIVGLAPGFWIKNGASDAAAHTLTIDWVEAAVMGSRY